MGKPISKKIKIQGLAKMAKSPKGKKKKRLKKMGFNPDRMVAKKGGRVKKMKRKK